MPYRIVPKPGAKLRHPDPPHAHIPAEGITVQELTPFWLRRKREGGVTIENLAQLRREEA